MNNSGARVLIFFTVLFIAAILYVVFRPPKEINIDDLQTIYGVVPMPSDTGFTNSVPADSTIAAGLVEVNDHEIQQDTDYRYFIIIGSSRSHELALKKAGTLHEQYKSDIFVLPVSKEGFYRISFGRYRTREEANSRLQSVRSATGPDAWIYSAQ